MSVLVTEECCAICRHFYEYGEECRAHPPVVVLYQAEADERAWPHTLYPSVLRQGWCGEWKDGRE